MKYLQNLFIRSSSKRSWQLTAQKLMPLADLQLQAKDISKPFKMQLRSLDLPLSLALQSVEAKTKKKSSKPMMLSSSVPGVLALVRLSKRRALELM